MADVIVLPKMGLTAEDGEVVRWLVAVGERVRQGQEIVEVETYKATLTVESPIDGVLRAAVDPGTTVPAGAVIGIVADPEESLDGLALWDSGADQAATGGAGARLRASPVARRIARELGVDLAAIKGSGPHGRITERDVQAAAATLQAQAPEPSKGRRVALTSMRRAIAQLMTASAQVPQFTLEATAGLAQPAALARRSPRVSYSSVLIAACAHTLRDIPAVNSSFDGDALIEHAEINIGVAVALDQGLIVPVIHNADRHTLEDLDEQRQRLTESAKCGTLTADDLLGATFTVSNLGPLGVERFRALVVPPQAAILAVGAVRDERIALSLSCDHRVLDGAPAARFLAGVVARLEQPDWLEALR